MSVAKFPLGHLYATANAAARIPIEEISKALYRHIVGDWGDLDPEDRSANDMALKSGSRILSSYRSESGLKFWVITEWDRSSTTVLLPEDY